MKAVQSFPRLPLPVLRERTFGHDVAAPIVALSDEGLFAQTGVRIAFTERLGGQSKGPYESLNLGLHVGDSGGAAIMNHLRLFAALAIDGSTTIRPKQVHGTTILLLDSADEATVHAISEKAKEGADGVIVTAPGAGAQLCFADCVPVIIVSPTGAFAVVHAGWRGVVASIASEAVRKLARIESAPSQDEGAPFASAAAAASSYNVYIGPYIHTECFECGPEVVARFVERFGAACSPDGHHVDLGGALRVDLADAGIDVDHRLADADVCTACDTARFYSYRASGGVCGRHGALAFREA